MKLSDKDLDLLEKKGISKQTIDQQMQLFKNGLPFINLKRAATVDDGIIKLTAKEENEYIKLYDNEKENIDIVKFVPASGAATRMFKFLFQFLDSFRSKEESINAYINRKKALDLSIFFIGLEKLPFFTKVISYLKEKHSNYSELSFSSKETFKGIFHQLSSIVFYIWFLKVACYNWRVIQFRLLDIYILPENFNVSN